MPNDAPAVWASFEGIPIEKVIACAYSCNHGISPSAAILDIVGLDENGFTQLPTREGELVLGYGSQELSLTGCRIDRHSVEVNQGGIITRLSIYDRRWKWRYGSVSGRYNLRYDDNADNIVLGTARTPQQLATLCLDAMHEIGYDVSALPNSARPEVAWDFTRADIALDSLCAELGCRVVFDCVTNTTSICKVGQGASLGLEDAMPNISAGNNPPETPDRLFLVTAPIRVQMDLPLEPMAEEEDGSYVKLDDASYKPTGGWDKVDLHFMEGINVTAETAPAKKARIMAAARRSVFKVFRVKLANAVSGDDYKSIQLGPLKFRSLIELQDELVEVYKGGDGNYIRHPAMVWGLWKPLLFEAKNRGTLGAAGTDGANNPFKDPTIKQTPTEQLAVYQNPITAEQGVIVDVSSPKSMATEVGHSISFSVDTRNFLVRFSEPITRIKTTAGVDTKYAALLSLRTTVTAYEATTRAPYRLKVIRQINVNPPDGVYKDLEIIRNDIVPEFIEAGGDISLSGTNQSGPPGGSKAVYDNLDKVQEKCNYYLDQEEAKYLTPDTQTVKYAGLKKISLDGAIQQVTFSVSQEGFTTTAARNTEVLDFSPSYAQRQLMSRMDWLALATIPKGLGEA